VESALRQVHRKLGGGANLLGELWPNRGVVDGELIQLARRASQPGRCARLPDSRPQEEQGATIGRRAVGFGGVGQFVDQGNLNRTGFRGGLLA
jgi:hypothetical protein